MCKGSGDAAPGLGPLPLANTGGGLVKTGSGRMLQRSASVVERLASLAPAFAARERLRALHRDLTVLKQIWCASALGAPAARQAAPCHPPLSPPAQGQAARRDLRPCRQA